MKQKLKALIAFALTLMMLVSVLPIHAVFADTGLGQEEILVDTQSDDKSENQGISPMLTPSYTPSSPYRSSKYYTQLCNVSLGSNVRTNLVNIARSQLGYHEGNSFNDLGGGSSGSSNYTEYGYWYGTQVAGSSGGYYYAWCAYFISWCARQAGIPTSIISNASYACAGNDSGDFKNLNYYPRGSYTPQAGDLIFFDWASVSGPWDHVEIVTSVSGSSVTTIGGNTGDNNVKQRTWSLSNSEIQGYGVPKYSGSSIPPDPPAPSGSIQDLNNPQNPNCYPTPPSNTYLNVGDSGNYVKWLQACLNQSGHTCDVDGQFGYGTAEALKAFQRRYGLTVDGGFGPECRTKILQALTVATPSISTAYDPNGTKVTINCSTGGATIFYTTNGSNPTESSHKYTGPFVLSSNATVKAIAMKNCRFNSGIYTWGITVTKHTVTFKDWNGTVLKTQTVYHSGSATAPANPSRTGYTFTGWDKPFTNVTSNLVVTAQYRINTYTVTFKDWNGTVLKTQSVNYGGSATAPANPSREGYTFTGWDRSFTNVTSNITVTAQYSVSGPGKPVVSFVCMAQRVWLGWGLTPAVNTHHYDVKIFPEGSNTPAVVQYNVMDTYFACDLPAGRYYARVTACNQDGSLFNISDNTDVFTVTDITDEDYQPVASVTSGNHRYILYADRMGSWQEAKEFCERQGGHLVTITSAAEQQLVQSLLMQLNENASCWLGFQRLDNDSWGWITNEAFSYTNWREGQPDNYAGSEDYGMLSGDNGGAWNDITMVTDRYDINVVLEIDTAYHTVTFKDWNGTVLKTESVEHGGSATAPADPTRQGYTFTGWDRTFTNVTSDLVVTAQYEVAPTPTPTPTATPTPTPTATPTPTPTATPTSAPIPSNAPKIVVESKTTVSGSTVTVDVKLENNPGFVSMKLHLSYDSNLTLINVEDRGLIPGKMHDSTLSNPYLLVWDNDTEPANFTVNGTLVTLTFTVAEGAEAGNYPVEIFYDLNADEIFDFNLDPVEFAVVNGNITVTDVIIGDINSDGKVTAKDRALLGRYLAGWESVPESMINLAAADVNLDGKVSAKDRAILGRYLAGWEGYSELPYTGKGAALSDDKEPATVKGTPSIVVDTVTANPGDTVTIEVNLQDNPGFVSMKLHLSYDSNLTLIRVEDTGLIPGKMHDSSLSNPYLLVWDNDFATENFTVNGALVRLTFVVAEDAVSGTYPVEISYDLDADEIFDFDLEPVEFAVVNGGVAVESSEPETYTITYTINGEEYAVQTYEVGEAVIAPEYTVPEGHTFSGWEIPETMPAENLVFDAVLTVNTYTITYMINGEEYTTQTYEYGAAVSAPEYNVPEGYSFTGWNVPATMPAEDIVVTAQCSINVYSVVFYDWDGSIISEQLVEHGNAAIAPADPTREGYNFIGWSIDFSNITSDCVIYAVYSPIAGSGDIDGDGLVTSADAVILMRHVLGISTDPLTPEQIAAADVNGDGILNSTDALLIVRCALGLIETISGKDAVAVNRHAPFNACGPVSFKRNAPLM